MKDFIKPYQPGWKTEFQHLKQVLETILNGIVTDIQHVGSTAIPGLVAKPVLDIDIIIFDKTLLENVSARLEQAGYSNKGEQGIAGRFAFRQINDLTPCTTGNKQWYSHHLYVCYSDSLALKNHLVFRDALLGNKELVAGYAQLKQTLCEEPGMTRELYTKRKTDFILSVLAELGAGAKELNAIRNANS